MTTVISIEQAVKLAAELLSSDEQTARQNYKVVPEVAGWYFWNPCRGGASVIVNNQGEKLTATSALGFERHLNAFLSGKRS